MVIDSKVRGKFGKVCEIIGGEEGYYRLSFVPKPELKKADKLLNTKGHLIHQEILVKPNIYKIAPDLSVYGTARSHFCTPKGSYFNVVHQIPPGKNGVQIEEVSNSGADLENLLKRIAK